MTNFAEVSSIIASIVASTLVFLMFRRLKVWFPKYLTEEGKTRFFKALKLGLRSGAIANIEDVVNVYIGVSGLSSEDLSYRYGLSKALREFLVTVVSREKSIAEDSIEDETIKDWKQKITNFISQNEALSPYADLPPAERNVLNDMSTFLKNNDLESVKRKTLELAGMIQARHDELEKNRNINKWSVPVAIIGVFFTVLFGVWTLVIQQGIGRGA